MAKLFGECFLLRIEMIVRVNGFVGKIPNFFVVFHFSDFNEEVSDEINNALDTDKHEVVRIGS